MATTKRPSSDIEKMKAGSKYASQLTPNYCSLIKIPARVFEPGIGARRAEMIVITQKKWVNGTRLKYYFFNGNDGSPASWGGTAEQKDTVRQAFNVWKNLSIGLDFEETTNRNAAMIRIGFMQGDGSWSYIGRDILDFASSPNERTMNFGWDISKDIDTAIHEIGHTLGAPHEHQNPNAGIVWNEEAVYNALAQPPNNWDRDTTFHNIIRKLPVNEVDGSTHDPNSIMHYPFGPGLILSPAGFANGIFPAGGLSVKDKEFMKRFYPPIAAGDITDLQEAKSVLMDIAAGEQRNFVFRPSRSRKYKIETFGTMDTIMVLFERENGEERYLAADDDSGTNNNSKIHMRLLQGREYIIRVRMFYAEGTDRGSVMVY